jgi:putative ATP-dependent endonuclease of the OLD family
MSGGAAGTLPGSDAAASFATLVAVRIAGFRGLTDLEIELDSVTTLTGEHAGTKAAFVDLLDLCLGPGAADDPRFVESDFGEPAATGARRIRAMFWFVEGAPGAWRNAEPLLAGASAARRRTIPSVEIEIGADWRGGGRVESHVIAYAGSKKETGHGARAVWRRLRSLCPVLVLGADRVLSAGAARGATPGHAEIGRLYRKLRESRGRLSEDDLEAARAVLRDDLHLGAPEQVRRPARELLDVVDGRRPGQKDVTDDAVQDVLLRLLRAGLLLEAQKSGRIDQRAKPIVVVDAPEARLHPTLAARVWRFLSSVASQVIVSTNSAEVVAASPLRSLRRLTPGPARVEVNQIKRSDFSLDDFRRLVYHVRLKRGASLLARAWLLVEGETEHWILSEFASMLGYSLAAEGVACVEFAQCGLAPMIRLADLLGIGWHVLTDGDSAGLTYATQARSRLRGRNAAAHLTALREPDIEHELWHGGYSAVFTRASGNPSVRPSGPRATIRRALARGSKPLLAIRVIETAVGPGSPGVPASLASAITAVVALARRSGPV